MELKWMALDGCSGHEAGRQLLEELYREKTGEDCPEILIAPRGKPYFAASCWHFSISHTKNHAFCVLASCPVGCDAEEKDRDINLRLAEKILSQTEFDRWEAAADKRDALLRLWVLKEAAAKLTGEGLKGYPNYTEFSLNDPRVKEINGCLVAVLEGERNVI